eukprot:4352684-Pyramimonas_sp.AAC.1
MPYGSLAAAIVLIMAFTASSTMLAAALFLALPAFPTGAPGGVGNTTCRSRTCSAAGKNETSFKSCGFA